MRKTCIQKFYLCIIFLLILSACSPKIPLDWTETEVAQTLEALEEAEPTEEPEEPTEAVEEDLEFMLEAGTAMQWYDDGYIVFVPAGEVTLGDNQYENNMVHSVFVDDYWIYMFKVTNGQYSHCVATGTCTPPASEEPYPDFNDLVIKDEPVIGVTWEQAETYCNWMNGRLPTKAEWEKATRGPQARTYPWGEEDPDCDLLNYGECEDPEITRVYEYPEGRSFYNAFDLAGNTYEWVFDLYEDDFISQLPDEPPAGPPEGTERSVRGSSYTSGEELIPSAQLFYLEPENYRTDLGFRCVLGEAEPKAFAHPCIQTAFIPGSKAPWDPAPAPDPNDLPDLQELDCKPEREILWSTYCSNQTLQHGGLDVDIFGLNGSDVYLKNYTSNQGVACIDNGINPIQCFGPEGAAVNLEICASCMPYMALDTDKYYCNGCYSIEHTNPPRCVYHGGPPPPGGSCPAGYVYDLVNDICQKIVMQTTDCPAGYEYDANTDCCVASFAGTDQGPGQLSNMYLTCPPGAGNVVLLGQQSTSGDDYATCSYGIQPSINITCENMQFHVGQCEDLGCTNPGNHTTEASCQAANCKWVRTIGPTGAPLEKCVYP